MNPARRTFFGAVAACFAGVLPFARREDKVGYEVKELKFHDISLVHPVKGPEVGLWAYRYNEIIGGWAGYVLNAFGETWGFVGDNGWVYQLVGDKVERRWCCFDLEEQPEKFVDGVRIVYANENGRLGIYHRMDADLLAFEAGLQADGA